MNKYLIKIMLIILILNFLFKNNKNVENFNKYRYERAIKNRCGDINFTKKEINNRKKYLKKIMI